MEEAVFVKDNEKLIIFTTITIDEIGFDTV
jgi:hypothetical protein